jgi:Flp pilus assembly protein TadD
MRATCPDAAVRDGAKALEAARRLDDLTGHQMADVLDVLAAAYAQAGDFAQARQTVQQAVAIARRINMPQLAQEIAQRADLYAASQPYRQP